jgi:homoserine dehydrogenase
MTRFDLVLVGFGNVARRFVSLLAEHRATLARDFGVMTRVVGIATRRHGRAYAAAGLQPYVVSGFSRTVTTDGTHDGPPHQPPPRLRRSAEASAKAEGGHYVQSTTGSFLRDALKRSAAAARQRRLVVIETTPLDIARGEPAISHIRAALAGGAHVVTANKGPVAFAYRTLAAAADRAGRQFRFEGAVMDGVPVFNLVRETLPAVHVLGFRGVVNSTTNYMLTEMERGQAFDAALADMQARGVAEADASLDVDGWDAAAKAAALANVLFDARITPLAVDRQGITPATGRLAIEARAKGRRVKLVASGARDGRRILVRVAPEELPADDLLAGLEGQQNALILRTDLLEEIAVVQRSGSLTQTAYALLSDLLSITEARATRRWPPPARRRRSP